jgi:hypothetical protein
MTLDDIDRIEAGAVEVVANRLDSIAEAQQRVARSIGASGGQTCREAAVLLRSYARALAAPATQAAAPEVRGEAVTEAMVAAATKVINEQRFGENYNGKDTDMARDALTAALVAAKGE